MRNIFIYSGIALITLLTLIQNIPAQAADIDQLKTQIDTHNSTIKQLEDEIRQYQAELNKTTSQKQTLQTAVQSLDINGKKIDTSLKVTENKVSSTNLTIQKLGAEITDKEKHIESNQLALAETIRKLNETDNQAGVIAFLQYPNISTFLDEVITIQKIQEGVKGNLDGLRTLKSDLQISKQSTEEQRNNLNKLIKQLAEEKTALEINKAEKAKLLNETKNQESNYKKIIADKQAKKAAFEKELLQYESQLKIAIDPKSVPVAKTGVLAWPLKERVITQNFGNTAFAAANAALYNGNGHNGIDLKAPIGTPIMAALDGVVEGTGNTDTVCPGASYGKWVFIRHPNGLSTLYAHFSQITVSPGQKVATGEVLGYSGNTGYATGPHLHFTVYASEGVQIMSRKSVSCGGTYTMPIADLKAYLNPLSYL